MPAEPPTLKAKAMRPKVEIKETVIGAPQYERKTPTYHGKVTLLATLQGKQLEYEHEFKDTHDIAGAIQQGLKKFADDLTQLAQEAQRLIP